MQLAGANATKWQAHKIDSTLWACGLRAQTIIGDDGPHMFNDTPGELPFSQKQTRPRLRSRSSMGACGSRKLSPVSCTS